MTIGTGLAAAFRLARARPDGLAMLDATPAGAARSFWAAAVCLPAFLALRLFSWAVGEVPSSGVGRALAAELIGYAIAWAGFALASRPLAEANGRGMHWPRFIAAWNWANVVQYIVLLGLAVPGVLGLPSTVANALALVALGYAVWLEWYVTRLALQIDGWRAAGFVGLDLMIGLFLGGLVARLSQ